MDKEEDAGKEGFPEWIVEIKNITQQKQTYHSEKSWTICEVPTSLKKGQQNAFVPRIISIGPFHSKKNTMRDHKKRYLLHYLAGEHSTPRDVCIEKLYEAMKQLELKTRKHYSESFGDDSKHRIASDDFVGMMVMDGCFVIELLQLYHKSQANAGNADEKMQSNARDLRDPLRLNTRWLLPTIQRDLIKLENQLPFCVLKKLYEMSAPEGNPSLEDLILKFHCSMLSLNESMTSGGPRQCPKHQLDLLHSMFYNSISGKLPPKKQESKATDNPKLIHSAQELQEAGVKFRKKDGSNLLDVSFEKGVLRIPPLSIDESMTTLLLNLVAYEQCEESESPIFTNYFLFLDSLINT